MTRRAYRRTLLVLLCLLAGSMLGAGVCQAFDDDDADRPRLRDRMTEFMLRFDLHPAAAKLGRGLANITTGWLELPLMTQRLWSSHDTATAFCTGLIVGVVRAVGRTGVGVYEAATFFIPYPEHYEPILPPLEYFTEEGKTLRR